LGWVVACFSCRQIDGIRRHKSTNRRRCADGTLPASNMRQPPSPHRALDSPQPELELELEPDARCQVPVPGATTRASVAPCLLTYIPLHHCCLFHHQVLCPHLPGRDVRKRRCKDDAKTTQRRRKDDCTRRETYVTSAPSSSQSHHARRPTMRCWPLIATAHPSISFRSPDTSWYSLKGPLYSCCAWRLLTP
jgi:hypothetical protein